MGGRRFGRARMAEARMEGRVPSRRSRGAETWVGCVARNDPGFDADGRFRRTCVHGSWTGPAEGSWTTAEDWSTGIVPTSTDVACIGAGKTVDVTVGTNQTGVVQGEGTLVISGGSLEVGECVGSVFNRDAVGYRWCSEG